MSDPILDAVYAAQSPQQAEAGYDAWAARYDRDLMAMGYRLACYFPAVLLAHVPFGDGPVLDAGCGTGLHLEGVAQTGWRGIIGVDLSSEMLAMAQAKGIYDRLHHLTLGQPLPFEDSHFAASLSCGTITPGHAPPDTLDELIRVTKPGGRLVFTLRHDAGQDPSYLDHFAALQESGRMTCRFSTPSFKTMPYGEPEVENRIHVCEVHE